jgi:hypothetical protein
MTMRHSFHSGVDRAPDDGGWALAGALSDHARTVILVILEAE